MSVCVSFAKSTYNVDHLADLLCAKLSIDVEGVELYDRMEFQCGDNRYSGYVSMVNRDSKEVRVTVHDTASPTGSSDWTFGGEHLNRVWMTEPPPPRRRTEPAITVTCEAHCDLPLMLHVGDHVQHKLYGYHGRIAEMWTDNVHHSVRLEGSIAFWPVDQMEHVPDTRPVWAPAEVEAIVTFGSDRYAKQAMVCDEARTVEIERYWAEATESWKKLAVERGYDLDTDWDWLGEKDRAVAQETAETRRRLAALPRPLPTETARDYACRTGMRTAKQMGISVDDWLMRVEVEMGAVLRREPVNR